MTISRLKEMDKEEAYFFIRSLLNGNESNKVIAEYTKDCGGYRRVGKRFNMSGYDEYGVGSCVLHNTEIVNLFAHLGIYDYSKFLYLDFYKGCGVIYMDGIEEEMGGHTTTDIIYKILELTVLSVNTERRRS